MEQVYETRFTYDDVTFDVEYTHYEEFDVVEVDVVKLNGTELPFEIFSEGFKSAMKSELLAADSDRKFSNEPDWSLYAD